MLEGSADIKDVPYQRVRDSPTLKFYSSWEKYESGMGEPVGIANPIINERMLRGAELVELRPDGSYRGSLEEESPSADLFSVTEGRILAKHLMSLKSSLKLKVNDGENRRVEIIYLAPEAGSSHHHIRIDVGRESSAEIALISSARSSAGVPITTIEAFVGEGSKLRIWRVSVFEREGLPISWLRVSGRGASEVEVRNVLLGGGASFASDEISLIGSKSAAKMNSFLMAMEGEKVDHLTNISNNSPGSNASIFVNGFNFGGVLVHRGKLKVTREALESENKLSSIFYRIGSGSKTYSVPSLEVEGDFAVSASHETSVSPLPEIVLFYMKSRGLNERESLEVMVRSSLSKVLEGMDGDAIENVISEILLRAPSGISP